MGIIINMLPPTVRIIHTLPNMQIAGYRMAREFALSISLPKIIMK